MKTRNDLKKAANNYGAVIVFNAYNPHDQSTIIEVEAPDGFKWSDGPQVLCSSFFSYEPHTRYEAYEDLINRMSYGIEPIKEEEE